jgi:hypothetical protein
MKKTCRQCGQSAEHYNSITTCCKECWKERVKANRRDKAEHYRAFDKKRNKTPERKAAFIAKQRRKRATIGPDYDRAHYVVANAIKKGSLVMPDHCSRCKINCAPQAHHDDHSKYLAIMWLCPICHAARHVELGKLK